MAKDKKLTSQGLAEEPAKFKLDFPKPEQKWRLTIGKDGRVVIPAAAREHMELGTSGVVVAKLVDGELRLMSPATGMRRIQEISMKHKVPGESVVDDFIAERRAEAAREDQEG
jgi:bifunctional DNA-binding transcriptional regulator/antitoxin component of YhaV-PrlF toxin-antitoxin module